MSSKQLALCKSLLQAVMACQQQCQQLVPEFFNNILLGDLQQLMQQAVQLHQEEQLLSIRAALEASLQLLSRVSSLGRIEAFFVADELLVHYQWQIDATQALLCRLGHSSKTCAHTSTRAGAATARNVEKRTGQQRHSSSSCSSSSSHQLKLPDQQHRIVYSFRRQAAKLCPMLAQSCPPAALQQLCDTVKQGLVLVNGHSFLIGQEWHAEVSAMLARAEQLKVLLSHWQAHHLSLLASVLQLLHQQEVQEFDRPRSASSSPGLSVPAKQPKSAPASGMEQGSAGQGLCGPVQQEQQQLGLAAAATQLLQGQEQQQQAVPAHVLVLTGIAEVAGGLEVPASEEDDDFFLPVAPLAPSGLSQSSSAGPVPGPASLPFHISCCTQQDGVQRSSCAQSDGDSLARTPSSGCSSLLEYVQNSMTPATGMQPAAAAGASNEGFQAGAHSMPQQVIQGIEQQLLSIAGSAEVAAALAAALGLEQQHCSRSSSYCGSLSPTASPTATAAAAATGSLVVVTGRESSVCSGKSSPGQSRPASVLGRLSSASRPLVDALLSERSSGGGGGASLRLQQQGMQQQQQRQRWRWRWRASQPSKSLCLQHVQLPPGCCKSIGVVCYLCPHLQRVALVDVGLTDEAVGNLVDALRVNSSVRHLDLSHNQLEDIGARVLAILLRPSAGCSSRLRTLCLQHNQIGDDGAAALASGLASGSGLQRLWLQHNAIGERGAQALCRAMQHNTACTDLKLQPGNVAVPTQLAQTARQLSGQNRGARDYIKGLLKMANWHSQ